MIVKETYVRTFIYNNIKVDYSFTKVGKNERKLATQKRKITQPHLPCCCSFVAVVVVLFVVTTSPDSLVVTVVTVFVIVAIPESREVNSSPDPK